MRKRGRGQEVKGKKTKDKPKCTIYIFCEGQTERIYLEHFENRIYNVSIVPVNTKHTDAVGIVKYAEKYIRNVQMDQELGDRGYCVFDSDPKSNPNIQEAFEIISRCRKKGLYCIFSNPCFEVWFVMHFREAPYGYDADKMKKCLKRILQDEYPNYSETVDIYEFLKDRQETALKRSIALHKSQEQIHKTVYSHECNPYTDIFEFMKYMDEIKKRTEMINDSLET